MMWIHSFKFQHIVKMKISQDISTLQPTFLLQNSTTFIILVWLSRTFSLHGYLYIYYRKTHSFMKVFHKTKTCSLCKYSVISGDSVTFVEVQLTSWFVRALVPSQPPGAFASALVSHPCPDHTLELTSASVFVFNSLMPSVSAAPVLILEGDFCCLRL